MEDIKAKARAFLAERWAEVLEAEEYDEAVDIAKRLRHDFYVASEMYEALFNEEVTGTTLSGVIYEAKEEV